MNRYKVTLKNRDEYILLAKSKSHAIKQVLDYSKQTYDKIVEVKDYGLY